MTTSTIAQELVTPLTLTDRCDRCGSQAFYRAMFVSGDLTFCGHHGRELLVPLQRYALFVEDSTEFINGMPTPNTDGSDAEPED